MQDEVVIRQNRTMLKMWVVALTVALVFFITMLINDYLNGGGGSSMWIGVIGCALILMSKGWYYTLKKMPMRNLISAVWKKIKMRSSV